MKTKFIIIQSILYTTFLLLDLTAEQIKISSSIKLTAIGFCLIWLVVNYIFAQRSDKCKTKVQSYQWMVLIMSFTFVSDIFLLFTSNYAFGIATFILVQLLYAFRIRNFQLNRALALTIVVFIFFILTVLISKKMPPAFAEDIMLVEVVVYALIFSSNLLRYGKHRKDSIQNKWMFIGLCLYAICDLQVGIYNLPSNIMVPSILTEIAAIGMWLFYLPGQVILTLSADKKGLF